MNKQRIIVILSLSMAFVLISLYAFAGIKNPGDGQKGVNKINKSSTTAASKDAAVQKGLSDEEKMKQAEQIFQKFREQSDAVDRSQLSRMNYVSLYRSNLRNSLVLAIKLADFGNYKEKVNQYNRHMKFTYKSKEQLTEERDQKINDWSSDILNRCLNNEKDLLDFIQDALETCGDALAKYAFNNPTSMVQDKTARQDIRDFLKMESSYTRFKEAQEKLEQDYPEICSNITSEIDRWIALRSTSPQGELPSMSKQGS